MKFRKGCKIRITYLRKYEKLDLRSFIKGDPGPAHNKNIFF